MVRICNGTGIINSFPILVIDSDEYKERVKDQIRELIKNKFMIRFPQIQLNINKTIQLNGIAYI